MQQFSSWNTPELQILSVWQVVRMLDVSNWWSIHSLGRAKLLCVSRYLVWLTWSISLSILFMLLNAFGDVLSYFFCSGKVVFGGQIFLLFFYLFQIFDIFCSIVWEEILILYQGKKLEIKISFDYYCWEHKVYDMKGRNLHVAPNYLLLFWESYSWNFYLTQKRATIQWSNILLLFLCMNETSFCNSTLWKLFLLRWLSSASWSCIFV